MRIFDKLKSGAQRLFNKVTGEAPRMMGKLSSGLQQGSNILKKGSQFASQVLNNPVVQNLATAGGFGPELGAINSVINGANKASQILGKTSNLSDIKSYRGDVKGVTNDILQRAKSIKNDVDNIPQFA